MGVCDADHGELTRHGIIYIPVKALFAAVRALRETEGETDAICYAVYRNKAYFLNMDTRHERTFDYVLDGKKGSLTLKPCEIRVVERHK